MWTNLVWYPMAYTLSHINTSCLGRESGKVSEFSFDSFWWNFLYTTNTTGITDHNLCDTAWKWQLSLTAELMWTICWLWMHLKFEKKNAMRNVIVIKNRTPAIKTNSREKHLQSWCILISITVLFSSAPLTASFSFILSLALFIFLAPFCHSSSKTLGKKLFGVNIFSCRCFFH